MQIRFTQSASLLVFTAGWRGEHPLPEGFFCAGTFAYEAEHHGSRETWLFQDLHTLVPTGFQEPTKRASAREVFYILASNTRQCLSLAVVPRNLRLQTLGCNVKREARIVEVREWLSLQVWRKRAGQVFGILTGDRVGMVSLVTANEGS